MFNQHKMKDAWKGLRLITGQEKSRKDSAVTSTSGPADHLNSFYARFDKTDFSAEHQARQSELMQCVENGDTINNGAGSYQHF